MPCIDTKYQVSYAGMVPGAIFTSGYRILLIPRALSHAKLCKCSVVLVAPLWSSSPFWPVVRNSYLQYLTDILVVKGSKVLEQGLNKNAIFGSNSFTGEVIAIKFSF